MRARREPEAVICMARAYEGALLALRFTNRQDPFSEIVAKKIVEIAETGEARGRLFGRSVRPDHDC